MTLAIIGGTGLTQIENIVIQSRETLETPYGAPSAAYQIADWQGQKVIFLARHGAPHRIPPHKVNYRANVWGLKQLGASRIIGVAAVGGVSQDAAPARIVIPDQIIDYTYGREHTYFADDLEHVTHIDFTEPYHPETRAQIITAAAAIGLDAKIGGVYACTQGPRLETAAEIKRLIQDGATVVGMTGMPEAALTRELELPYANLSVVANWGAGLTPGEITMAEIERNLQTGMQNAIRLLEQIVLGAS